MEWISVKERNPAQRQMVLAYGRLTNDPDWDHKSDPLSGTIGIYMCQFSDRKSPNRCWDVESAINDCGWEGRKKAYVIWVTHWMPLPSTPAHEDK